jgi:hypothetical protein
MMMIMTMLSEAEGFIVWEKILEIGLACIQYESMFGKLLVGLTIPRKRIKATKNKNLRRLSKYRAKNNVPVKRRQET